MYMLLKFPVEYIEKIWWKIGTIFVWCVRWLKSPRKGGVISIIFNFYLMWNKLKTLLFFRVIGHTYVGLTSGGCLVKHIIPVVTWNYHGFLIEITPFHGNITQNISLTLSVLGKQASRQASAQIFQFECFRKFSTKLVLQKK